MTPDWRERLIATSDARGDDEVRLTAQRVSIEQRLTRLRRLLIDGLIEDNDYRAERAILEGELAAVAPSAGALNLE